MNEPDGRDQLNMIALLRRLLLLVLKIGGIVKGRSEREGGKKRRAGTKRTLIRCSFVGREEKQKTYFPVDLESSLSVYSSP